MTDDLSRHLVRPAATATADHPFAGLTILVVEDSHFASEALRLMGQRLGGRIRRADCLRSARHHLRTYRPNVVIADIGLPDGSGAELIGHIAAGAGPRPALFGLSGDPCRAWSARDAGADGFLLKPVDSLSRFRDTILAALPGALRPCPSATTAPAEQEAPVVPDPLALRDDLDRAAALLASGKAACSYVAGFLSGLASVARDEALRDAARDLGNSQISGKPSPAAIARTTGLLRARLAAGPPI